MLSVFYCFNGVYILVDFNLFVFVVEVFFGRFSGVSKKIVYYNGRSIESKSFGNVINVIDIIVCDIGNFKFDYMLVMKVILYGLLIFIGW